LLFELIVQRKPDFRPPQWDRWATQVDRMLTRDGRSPERIEAVIRWCQQDPFWQNNILNTARLRRHFDRLELAMGDAVPTETTGQRLARLQREDTP
jgi:hypothetical protein